MNPDPINDPMSTDVSKAFATARAKRIEEDLIKETMFSLTNLLDKPGIESGYVHYMKVEGKWKVTIYVKPKNMVRYQITTSDDILAKALADANKGLDRYLAEEVSL